jgi:site-specific DNA recombinase
MSAKSPALIPSVGYLRKSDKKGDAYEVSLADQKARIKQLKPPDAGFRYDIVAWFTDPGIQGWKRGHKRPDYFRMVNFIREKRNHIKAVLIDDMDRFSRADSMETVADVQTLRELGVRYIHAVNQGVKDLTRDVAMVAMRIAMEANASHEPCTRLSRRIAETRKKKAEQGLRTGGVAPYAMANDGKGGLKPYDPKQVKTLRWLFEQFDAGKSLNWLAGDLNRRGIRGPTGGRWYVKTIRELLKRRCYRGDFHFNRVHGGQFHGIDEKGNVVDRAELVVETFTDKSTGEVKEVLKPGKEFITEGVYDAIVDPALFDRVQKRLGTLTTDRSQRKRMGYALTGILKCDHCGLAMYGTLQHGEGSARIYKCKADSVRGTGACGHRQVREDEILPFILKVLGEEITHLEELLTLPPENLAQPHKERTEQRQQTEQERDKLAQKIAKAEENLLFIEDARTRKSLDGRITAMRDELDRLEAELSTAPAEADFSQEDAAALAAWWRDFKAKAVEMPLPANAKITGMKRAAPDTVVGDQVKVVLTYVPPEQCAVRVDPLTVNRALLQLGCEVRLRWETVRWMSSSGTEHNKYVLKRGRFRLGQHDWQKIPRKVLEPSASRR